jgi:hypothetical protein
LRGVAASAPVDLFVRPEQLQMVDADEPCATSGTVAAQVYQGGHVDLYIDCAESVRDRLLVRSARHDAMADRRTGWDFHRRRRRRRVRDRIARFCDEPT